MKTLQLTAKFILVLMMVINLQHKANAALYSINIPVNGAQCVPPVTTPATGTLTGTYNTVTKVLNFNCVFSGLTGFTTQAHFHGPIGPTGNAGIIFAWGGFPVSVQSGNYTSNLTLSATHETQLLGGLWYANIHTTTFGGGEIRGQVYPQLIYRLTLTTLIEGMYDNISNLMVRDTVTANVRLSVSPYSIAATKKAYLSTSGAAAVDYNGITDGVNYYIQILHRNGLETWSKTAQFTSNALTYNFTTAAAQAFGDNLKLKGTKYCNFSGDISQDGIIDGTDGSLVDNAAANFSGGYVAEDCDGNEFVDGSDGSIVDNNASMFVTASTP